MMPEKGLAMTGNGFGILSCLPTRRGKNFALRTF
jgi:hypothetical protein